MKKCAAAILLLLIMAQSFYSATIYIWYQVNRTYITNAFCVNKARPAMKCNGQCYLAKQLQQAEEKNPPQQLKEWLELAPFETVQLDPEIPKPRVQQPFRYAENSAYSFLHSSAVFHPPLS